MQPQRLFKQPLSEAYSRVIRRLEVHDPMT